MQSLIYFQIKGESSLQSATLHSLGLTGKRAVIRYDSYCTVKFCTVTMLLSINEDFDFCWFCLVKAKSTQGQVAHTTRGYHGFCSVWDQEYKKIKLLPLGWDASPLQHYPPALYSPLSIYTPGWRETLCSRMVCLQLVHTQ